MKNRRFNTKNNVSRQNIICSNNIVFDLFPQISAQVSSQVRQELQALFYGSGGAGELPEPLLLWLSQRYVSAPDLRDSLAALEMNILRNVSQQLQLQRADTLDEAESQAKLMVQTVTGTVRHAAAAEGLTEEVNESRVGREQEGVQARRFVQRARFPASSAAGEADCSKRPEALLTGPDGQGGLRSGVRR